MDIASFYGGQWTYPFYGLYRVIMFYLVTLWNWTVDTSDCRAWFVDAEYTATGVATWVAVIKFYSQTVSQIVGYSHWPFCLIVG